MSLDGVTRRRSLQFVLLALATGACGQPTGSGQGQAGVGADLSDETARKLYQARGWRPAWDAGKASQLSQAVAGARAHGLDPSAFAPKRAPGIQNDESLTLAALAYARALSAGFVDPDKIERPFTLERNAVDLAAGLGQALDQGEVAAWLGSLAPADAEYKALSAAYVSALGQAGLPSAPTNGAPVGQSMAPPDQARQLAANLERRRWLTRTPPAHRIDVNTAVAFLAYLKPGQPTWTTRTVVGRDDHPTPSIQAAFQRLIANPPWRVPAEIAEREILPKGPGYLAREDMHWVNGLLEQTPGPRSALGRVKFDVEDPFDIYLHDTPSKALFAASDRHRSHGCVRVQDAVAFARSIAAETGQADAFDQALASRDTKAVELGQSIPVRMLYHTAYLGDDGAVQLAPDIYGTDEKLAEALGYGQAVAAHAAGNQPEVLFGP